MMTDESCKTGIEVKVMKIFMRISIIVFLLLTVVFSSGWAMDFDKMSNQELFELRGAIQNAPDQDREAYQLEWQKRLDTMTDEEKLQFALPAKGEKDDDLLPQPQTPARGYEKEGAQGQVIFGGFPGGGQSGK